MNHSTKKRHNTQTPFNTTETIVSHPQKNDILSEQGLMRQNPADPLS
ncbi:hypothetical protein L7G72_19705 [Xenorhabdus bovienii]|nr:hypothetical protein [Xenorhabdus bovienii]MCG3463990.1 hypothetical protein [Xenorhabdus bovienii]